MFVLKRFQLASYFRQPEFAYYETDRLESLHAVHTRLNKSLYMYTFEKKKNR